MVREDKDKRNQRKKFIQLRNAQDKELQIRYSRLIHDRLLQIIPKEAEKVFLYASYRNEVDTRFLMDKLYALGYRLALPKVEGKELEFYEIHKKNDLLKNRMGILEPDIGRCKRLEKEGAVLVVPLVAFDEACNRMGYGGGYYDRYLTHYRKNHLMVIGIAFELQFTKDLIYDVYDEALDCIITEKRIIKNKKFV